MTRKSITWLDTEGRFRISRPAYDDLKRPADESDDDMIARVVAKTKARHGLADDHTFHYVDPSTLEAKITELEGHHFRYAGLPDASNRRRDGTGGAWEMDTDGLPKLNMTKARVVQMDCIRNVRNDELKKLDESSLRALEAGDSSEQAKVNTEKQTLRDIPQTFDVASPSTPKELKEAWPSGLPASSW